MMMLLLRYGYVVPGKDDKVELDESIEEIVQGKAAAKAEEEGDEEGEGEAEGGEDAAGAVDGNENEREEKVIR
jgi:hypothetical protein